MIRRFQAAILLLLFALASSSGQVAMLQCLCSGKVVLPSVVGDDWSTCTPAPPCSTECVEDGCSHQPPLAPGEQPNPSQDPCQDGGCYVLIPALPVDAPRPTDDLPTLPVAMVTEVTAGPALVAPGESPILPPLPMRPPDPGPVALTVLYGSFLI